MFSRQWSRVTRITNILCNGTNMHVLNPLPHSPHDLSITEKQLHGRSGAGVMELLDRDGNPSRIVQTNRTEPMVFWTVFAGRKGMMFRQIKHIKELLKVGEIVEVVHLIDFTCRNKNRGT